MIKQILPNITIKEQFETIEILGITFCEGLKEATLINWQQIVQKMENHTNKLSSRKFSFYDKVTLLNA